MKRYAVLLAGIVLCACSTSEQGQQYVQSQYVGRKVDDFFIEKGPPRRSHKLNNGGTVYTWTGGVDSYYIPGSTTVTLTPTFDGGARGTADTTPGGNLVVSCTLDIHADPKGTIQSIRVSGDTVGAWELSRCAEYFRPKQAG